MTRRGRGALQTRDVVLAAAVALSVLVLAVAGVHRSRALTIERRVSSDRALVATVAAGVAGDLERAMRLVQRSAETSVATAGATLQVADVPGVDELAVLGGTSDGDAQPHPLVPGDMLADADVAAALSRARDTGEPQLAAPNGRASATSVLVVSAHHLGSMEYVGVAARRAAHDRWVVAPVDLAEVAAPHVRGDAVAAITIGSVVDVVGSAPPADAPEAAFVVTGREVVVTAGVPGRPGLPTATLLLGTAGVVLAAAFGWGVLVAAGRLRRHQAEADRRAQQARLMGDVAPIVQQSLDLSEVLPAVAVQLSDHFGLAGVTLSTGTTSAAQVELFSIGERPDPAARSQLAPPSSVRAGQTLSLALQRGGRGVALLQMVAGRDLGDGELQSLRAVTELVTSAIVNASLYASQQAALTGMRELDSLKTVFLSTASHELRTPVTAISGFTTLLAANWDRFDDDQRREFVVRIGANARSLGAVVQDLLDFSLLEKGTLSVVPEPVDLAEVVQGIIDRLSPSFPDHQIVLDVAPAPRVAADPRALDRIVTNLLTNAAKFSPAGTTVTTSVAPDPEVHGSLLRVCDEGPGVAPADRERIFTRFFRGSGDAVVQTRGVGIGLSVVAELVDRMDGSVTVGDAPGGGACFTVRFPPVAAELEEEVAARAKAT